jgi:hypothetical protein
MRCLLDVVSIGKAFERLPPTVAAAENTDNHPIVTPAVDPRQVEWRLCRAMLRLCRDYKTELDGCRPGAVLTTLAGKLGILKNLLFSIVFEKARYGANYCLDRAIAPDPDT